jgi:HNH endonuclease
MGAIKRSTRFKILAAGGFKCRYCGRSAPEVTLEVDHVTPKSKGGRNTADNLIAACFDCNRGKRDKLLTIDRGCDYLYCSDGCPSCFNVCVLPIRVLVVLDPVRHSSPLWDNDRLHAWYRCDLCLHLWATSWDLGAAKVQHEETREELIRRGYRSFQSDEQSART